jgi:hypothetical protein
MWRSLGSWVALAALLVLGLAAVAVVGRGHIGPADHNEDASTTPAVEDTANDETATETGCGPDAETVNIVTDPAFDVSDERHLVGYADNVFVGRVVRKLENVPPAENVPPLPTTLFAVEVQENIKGSLSGTVTVVQGGGCNPARDQVVLINNDPPLRPGEVAVFSTSKDSPTGPHSMIGDRFSHVPVETETQEARMVATFEAATREQVPFEPSRRGQRRR